LALSSSHNGTVSIHCTAGLLATNGQSNREQDTVDAELHHTAQQRGVGEVAAGRNVEVAAEGVAEAQRFRARARERLVDAPNQERQRLTEVKRNAAAETFWNISAFGSLAPVRARPRFNCRQNNPVANGRLRCE
jgi:hypothetical protein